MLQVIAFIKIILLKKIPAVVFVLFSVVMLAFMRYYPKVNSPQAIPMVQNAGTSAYDENIRMIRSQDYNYTHPLLLVDIPNESPQFSQVKAQIEQEITKQKQTGKLLSASVFLREQNGGHWMSVNGNEAFSPGSLIKVPALITYLKLAEHNPAWLTKEIVFEITEKKMFSQTFNANQIVPGKKYNVKELLYYMITYSDNNATRLLNENMDIGAFEKLFTDIGLNKPDVHDPNFRITAAEYSRFFRILYNSSYLTPENSEYALNLLTGSSFNEGITKTLPSTLKVAHKFGEAGNKTVKQLHETAIVFDGDNTYLLTVMTKANTVDGLPEVLSNVSAIVYNAMQQQHN